MRPYLESFVLRLTALTLGLALLGLATVSCRVAPTAQSNKIQFDVAKLDADGLVGPATGKRSLAYEFCIPNTPEAQAEVKRIDSTARFMPGSPGRIGCTKDQVLVIGETHQPNYQQVLNQLAALPYVTRIQEAVFE